MQAARFSLFSVGMATVLSTLTGSGPALAQGLSDGVGDIGLSFGYNDIETDSREAGVGFAGIDGSFTLRVAPQMLLGFDASWRMDDVASDAEFDFFGAPESQTVLATRALWELGPDTRLGGFISYGDTKVQPPLGAGFESFDYWLFGVEGRRFVNDDVMLYGQLAIGDDDEGDGLTFGGVLADPGEGFNNGRVVRLGATWFAGDRSAFTLDLEYATADTYVDNDAGEFFGVTLSGETRLPTAGPLFATYFLRSDRIDATTQNMTVDETTVGIGIRYVFGADTPREAARAGRSIGMPHLPARASLWTIFNDD